MGVSEIESAIGRWKDLQAETVAEVDRVTAEQNAAQALRLRELELWIEAVQKATPPTTAVVEGPMLDDQPEEAT